MQKLKNMRSRTYLFLCLFCGILSLPAALGLRALNTLQNNVLAATEIKLKISSGPKEGTYNAIAKSMVSVLAKKGIKLEVMESKGSMENLKNLAAGSVDIALAQLDAVGSLLTKGTSTDKIQLLLPMYSEQVHLVVRKNLKFSSLKDLKGKRIQLGEEGSGTRVSALALLSAAKINPEKDCTALDAAPGDALRALLGGKADAMFFTGGAPIPLFLKLSQTAIMQIKLASLPSSDIAAAEKTGFYHASSIAARTYNWQKEKINTAGVWAVALTTPKLSNADAAAFLDTIFTSLPDLRRLHRRWDVNSKALKEAMKIEGLKAHPAFLQEAKKYMKD